MSADIYKKVRANPKFAELEGKRSRFALMLTAIVMASYYGMMALVAFAPEAQADQALSIMRRHAVASGAMRAGDVSGRESPIVVLKTVLGTHRILDLLSGEQLPRIC